MNILVTGAAGFVGRHLCPRLMADGTNHVIAAVRNPDAWPQADRVVHQPGPWELVDWRLALHAVDTVVHLAGRVHVLRESSREAMSVYRRVNVAATTRLAEHCAAAGVRRFVFLSSIKVNGECTRVGFPFAATDGAQPLDPYGISKWEAELGLREIASRTELEVAIIRPPLVYGPGVKANMRSLMRWIQRGVPLPLGSSSNLRSLVAVDNLVDLVAECCTHQAAAGQTFLVSDGEDVSTAELVRRVAWAMNRPARLFPIPASLFTLVASVAGRSGVARRLFGSLQVNAEPTRRRLGWTPPVTLDEGLRRMTHDYLAGEGTR